MPRVKFDITTDERVVLPPIRSSVVHPYSDAPAEGISIQFYAFEEAYAEKIRALKKRTSPRDLYDVDNLFRNAEAQSGFAVLTDTIRQKCKFKSINFPVLAEIENRHSTSEDDWSFMLEHRLPTLPQFANFNKNCLPYLGGWKTVQHRTFWQDA